MKVKIGKIKENKTKTIFALNILEFNMHGISFDTFTFPVIVFWDKVSV